MVLVLALLLLIHVMAGQTLSGLAAQYHTTVASIMAANPQVTDANDITTGESLHIPQQPAPGEYRVTCNANVNSAGEATVGDCVIEGNGSVPSTPVPSGQPTQQPSNDGSGSSTSGGSSDLGNVPGIPYAYASCVAERESSDNPSAVNSIPGYQGNGGGAYGFLTSTWQGMGAITAGYAQPFDAPVSVQKAAFAALYREDGMSPWTADNCGASLYGHNSGYAP